jgi:hypothetical protein
MRARFAAVGLDPSALPVCMARHNVGALRRHSAKDKEGIPARPKHLTIKAPYNGPPARRAARRVAVATQARGSLLWTTGTSCVSPRDRRSLNKQTACHSRAPSRQSSGTKHEGRDPSLKWIPAFEAVRKSTGAWIYVVRPSRRPLRGLLRMRSFLNAIKELAHAEERPKGASRSTHGFAAAHLLVRQSIS